MSLLIAKHVWQKISSENMRIWLQHHILINLYIFIYKYVYNTHNCSDFLNKQRRCQVYLLVIPDNN